MSQVKSLWLILAAVAGVAFLTLVSAGAMMGGTTGPGMMGGAYGSAASNGWVWPMMAGGGWLMMLIFWLVIGAGLVLLIRGITNQSSRSKVEDSPDALEILRRRYAAGEIDEATYEHQREKLAA